MLNIKLYTLITVILIQACSLMASTAKTIIGQHVIIGIQHYPITEDWLSLINEYKISGVIFISNTYNSTEKIKKTITTIKNNTKHQLFYCIDQEGGTVQRIKQGMPTLPSAQDMALFHDTKSAYKQYLITAKKLKNIGINVNFAPVADVLSEQDNQVIGSRSYSENPITVASYAKAAVKAHQKAGILPVIKHFPGHGHTKKDSHITLPIHTNETLFESVDLFPFYQLLNENSPAVMVGHVLYPFLDKLYPASMSKVIITDLLKQTMMFNGLVFSDDMSMGAIKNNYTLHTASKKALQAGIQQLIIIENYNILSQLMKSLSEDKNLLYNFKKKFNSNIKTITQYKLNLTK